MEQKNASLVPDITSWAFAKEIREFSPQKFPLRAPRKVEILSDFPDPEGLLETAYASVKRVLADAGCTPTGAGKVLYRIRTEKAPAEHFEEYKLTLTEEGCLITAADTEGVRRGLYEFCDLFCAENGAFPPGGKFISRRPFLKTRLGRCPFSPIKRKPLNVDELLEETDYYPDALLDTLAHAGINGIWIVSALRELGKTSLLPEDPKRERRIAKLEKTVEKCRRYGIKVYLFMIEPFGVTEKDPLFQLHREMFADEIDDQGEKYGYCPASPLTEQYLTELLSSIFSQVPLLGGVVDIVLGERTTSCLPALPLYPLHLSCRSRCGLSAGEIMYKRLKAMRDGIRAGSPEGELIAWFYLPLAEEPADWVKGISSCVPEGVVPQFNFESGGEKEQLGKVRKGGDYWVSYDGPSPRFRHEALSRKGALMGAKLQLGCGYELSIVPGIPVPSVAFRKYRELARLNVTHVMQSWYLGNFPTVMTKAMGMLSFAAGNEEEDDFLLRLALPDWREDAPSVVRAWKFFDKAYQNFPFNLLFQYYAPQNNMPCWRFHFFPDLDPLAQPWKVTSIPGGDAVGEAMGSFTLEETIFLMEKLILSWQKGVEELLPLREKYAAWKERSREIGIAVFLLKVFQGSSNLLNFYRLRRALYAENGKRVLPDMVKIVEDQKRIFREIIPLLQKDSRLGFHGEALTRLFDENSVRKALEEADKALKEAEEILESPLPPRELAQKKGVWNEIGPAWRNVSDSFQWSFAYSSDILSLFLRGPKEGDFELKFHFMDALGCVRHLIESFRYEKGVLTSLGNNIHLTEGEGVSTIFHYSCEGEGDVGEWLFQWKRNTLPPVDGKLPFLRFNFLLRRGEKVSYAFGKGTDSRLWLGEFSPHDSALLCLAGREDLEAKI
ncbi:MAG: hypothetical protein J6A21_00635 [Lentisphaeria bacterium]|nr:hypothetical protein [Lentisphaeria bacterium]